MRRLLPETLVAEQPGKTDGELLALSVLPGKDAIVIEGSSKVITPSEAKLYLAGVTMETGLLRLVIEDPRRTSRAVENRIGTAIDIKTFRIIGIKGELTVGQLEIS
jgi:hypothetical protein